MRNVWLKENFFLIQIRNELNIWQHFGNRKSVSQIKMCNRGKIKEVYIQNLNKYI